MAEDSDVFKAPIFPVSLESSHVTFKIPQTRKLTDSSSSVETKEANEGKAEPHQPNISTTTKEETTEVKEIEIRSQTSEKSEAGYQPPVWSGPCTTANYDLDILKDGRIMGSVALAASGDSEEKSQSYYIFGRQGDIVMEHPSISRYHAVIQYRWLGEPHEQGWYLYDMGSTHGTFLNKEKIAPFMYTRIRVGHIFKLGFSTRMYILNGPEEDREPELGLSVTEIKERAQKQKLVMSQRRDPLSVPSKDETEQAAAKSSSADEGKDSGINWGMSDDYGEEKPEGQEEEEGESGMESIEDIQKREQFYVDDPRKALKNFFDRENASDEMQFECSERGTGSRHQWTCRIELPIETDTGRPVVAEATVSGSKKEATIACALEACRMLDAAGVLRKSSQEGRKRKSKEWAENDFYDSDEDTFLDRTGDVERKRAKRMRQVAEEEASGYTKKPMLETYDSLTEKLHDVKTQIDRTQQQLDLIRAEVAQDEERTHTDPVSTNKDSLDSYMSTMSRQDIHEAKMRQSRLRLKLAELKKSEERLEKLTKLVKPTSLPPIAVKTLETNKKQPILIGKMKGHRIRKLVAPEPKPDTTEVVQTGCKEDDVVEVEVEEDEDEDHGILDKAVKHDTRQKTEQSVSTSVSSEINASTESKPEKVEPKVYTVQVPEEMEPVSSTGTTSATPGLDKDETLEKSKDQPVSTKKRQRGNKKKAKQEKGEDGNFDDYDPTDINYAVWMPPENQSGDGTTSLNAKFGY